MTRTREIRLVATPYPNSLVRTGSIIARAEDQT